MQTNNGLQPDLERNLVPYLDTYQLNTIPFSANIPHDSFYIDADREHHLNHLTHLVQSSDLILVVSGDTGSGKTSLSQQFVSHSGEHIHSCQIKATHGLTEQELYSFIAGCYELPDNLNAQVTIELLRDHADKLKLKHCIPTILVDDADQLSTYTLKALLQLQDNPNDSEQDSPWRIILFTHPSFTAELMQLKNRLHFIQLSPLTMEQTKQYLQHRLHAAGHRGELPFTRKELDAIHRNSKGNLSLTHQFAHKTLMDKHSNKEKPMQSHQTSILQAIFKPGVIISGIAAIALTAVLLYQQDINNLLDQPAESIEIVAEQKIIYNSSDNKPAYLLAALPDSKPANPTTNKQAAVVENEKPQVPTTASKPSVPATKPKPATKPETPKVKKPVIKQKTRLAAASENKTQPKAAHSNNGKKLSGLLKQHQVQDKQWILDQTNSAFTAQLMASKRPDNLIKLANNPAIRGKTAIYHIMHNDHDWYVLVYGKFSDRNKSLQSMEQLPGRLKQMKPWIRSFEAVQQEIRAGKK